jgi:predicted permease
MFSLAESPVFRVVALIMMIGISFGWAWVLRWLFGLTWTQAGVALLVWKHFYGFYYDMKKKGESQ